MACAASVRPLQAWSCWRAWAPANRLLAGGRGSMMGTVLGALTLSALKVGLVVLGVDTFWQYIAMGAIIVVAAYFEVIQTTLESRISRLHVKS